MCIGGGAMYRAPWPIIASLRLQLWNRSWSAYWRYTLEFPVSEWRGSMERAYVFQHGQSSVGAMKQNAIPSLLFTTNSLRSRPTICRELAEAVS